MYAHTQTHRYNNNNNSQPVISDHINLVGRLDNPCCRRQYRHICVCSTEPCNYINRVLVREENAYPGMVTSTLKPSVTITCNLMLVQHTSTLEYYSLPNLTQNSLLNVWYGHQSPSNRAERSAVFCIYIQRSLNLEILWWSVVYEICHVFLEFASCHPSIMESSVILWEQTTTSGGYYKYEEMKMVYTIVCVKVSVRVYL